MKKSALLIVTLSLLSISTLARAQSAPAASPAPAKPAPAAASGPDCSSPDATQADLDICAFQDDQSADGVLNKTYATIRKQLLAEKATDSDTALVKAERAWITYRDLNCKAESQSYLGGSIYPEILSGCLEDMTKARTADLTSAYLTQQ